MSPREASPLTPPDAAAATGDAAGPDGAAGATLGAGRRELRWYLAGQTGYFAALGIQSVLIPYLVLQATGRADLVGIAQASAMLPGLFLLLVAGAVADARELRAHLMALQTVAALPPLALAMAAGSGTLAFWSLIAYGLAVGTVGSFIQPARDALLNRIVARSGIGLGQGVGAATASQFGGQILGYLIAALASTIGAAALLVLQGLLQLATTVATTRLSPAEAPPQAERRPLGRALADLGRRIGEGLKDVWTSPAMRPVVLMMFVGGILYIGVVTVVLPYIVVEVNGAGSFGLSLIFVAFFGGIGLSGFVLSRHPPLERPGRAFLLAMCGGSIGAVALHVDPPLWAVYAIVFLWGCSGGVSMSVGRTIVQTAARETHRARILSVYQLGFMGGGPIGALGAGYVVAAIGPFDAVLIPPAAMALIWLTALLTTRLWRLRAEDLTPS